MSTIKVDTIQKNGGASEISIDKLGGVTAAGSMIVVGEGGSTTTNLQQGLCKMWARLNGQGTIALDDSFNVASIADNGLGETTITFTSSPSNANYSVTQGSNNSNRMLISNAPNTTRVKCEVYEIDAANNPGDASDVCTTVHGDLA